jgi:hypothetical protein
MLSTVAEVVRDLLIFVGVLAVLLVALIVVVSKLPDTNPLKQLLTALCYRPRFSGMLAALCPTHQASEPSLIANPGDDA